MYTISSTRIIVITSILFTNLAGCGNVELLFLSQQESPFPIISEYENTITYKITKNAEGIIQSYPLINSTIEVHELNLSTLQSNLIKTFDAKTFFYVYDNYEYLDVSGIVASSKWIAWNDYENRNVKVLNRETNQTTRYFENSENVFNIWLRIIDQDRLIIHKLTGAGLTNIDERYEFIILDLNTGEIKRIGDSWFYGTFSIDDDYFALFNHQTNNINTSDWELTTNLDVVNLQTLERITIAPNIRVDGNGGNLFISNHQLYWQQFKVGESRTTLKSYRFNDKKIETIIATFEKENTDAWLIDMHNDIGLIKVQSGLPLIDSNITFQLQNLNGNITPVFSYQNSILRDPDFLINYYPQPRNVDHYVVWSDLINADFIIYDVHSRVTRRFDPRSLATIK